MGQDKTIKYTDRRLNLIEISFISSALSIRSCTIFMTFSRSARLSALTEKEKTEQINMHRATSNFFKNSFYF